MKLKSVLNKIEFVLKIFYIFASVNLVGLFLLMNGDLFGRLIFNSPIKGAAEFGTYMIVALAFLGLGYALIAGRHVRLTLVTMRLPATAQKVLRIVTLFISMAFFLVMTWQISLVANYDLVRNVIFPRTTVALPIWWISFFAALGTTVLAVSLIIQIIKIATGLESGTDSALDEEGAKKVQI